MSARAVLRARRGHGGWTPTRGGCRTLWHPHSPQPCPHVPAHTVDVGLDRWWHIKIDDSGHILEVDATRDAVLWVLALAGTRDRCWGGSGTPKRHGDPGQGDIWDPDAQGDTGKRDPCGYEDPQSGCGDTGHRRPRGHGDTLGTMTPEPPGRGKENPTKKGTRWAWGRPWASNPTWAPGVTPSTMGTWQGQGTL